MSILDVFGANTPPQPTTYFQSGSGAMMSPKDYLVQVNHTDSTHSEDLNEFIPRC